MDAYTLAVALAPTECHLSLSLLAAIGQVESGNLAGQRIDAQHRVVPGVLGPVLDGSEYAAIPDTDNGRWDGHRTWDRALGPLQLLPESWRVAGMDADGDGRRDPQNVYDAAGAAMVYLCDGGRDLGTRKGLEEAVLAYNHSRDYLRLVLAWKTVFDTADVTGLGSTPTLGCVGSADDPRSAAVEGSRRVHLGRPGGHPGRLPGEADGRRGSAATEADPHSDHEADRERRGRGRPGRGSHGGADCQRPAGPARAAEARQARGQAWPARRQARRARGQAERHPVADMSGGRADSDRRPQRRAHVLPSRTRGADRDAASTPSADPSTDPSELADPCATETPPTAAATP